MKIMREEWKEFLITLVGVVAFILIAIPVGVLMIKYLIFMFKFFGVEKN